MAYLKTPRGQVVDPGGGTMERAYAAPRADGTAAPTTAYMSPMWDSYFDRLAQASGGKMPVFANAGGARDLPDSRGDLTAQTSDLGEVRGSNITQPEMTNALGQIRQKSQINSSLAALQKMGYK